MAAPRPSPKCPVCRKRVPEDSKVPPFCSDRCRLVDLGRWFKGDYVVSRPLKEGDAETEKEEE